MMKRSYTYGALLSLFCVALSGVAQAATISAPLPSQAVPELDLERYQGIWYEVAHTPKKADVLGGRNQFVRIYPFLNDASRMHVVYESDRVAGTVHDNFWHGELYRPDAGRAGEFIATLKFGLQKYHSAYHVIAVDSDYKWAVIGEPTRQHLSIMSRQPYLDGATLNEIVRQLVLDHYYVEAPRQLRCTTQGAKYQEICKDVLRNFQY